MTGPKETASGGGVILNDRSEIVLVRNGPGPAWWGFPKGHVDPGESALQAAYREIEEETGLADLMLIRPLGSYTRWQGAPDGGEDRNELKTIHMFLFRTAGTNLKPSDSQNPEARWVARDDVAKMLRHEKDREFFESIKDGLLG